MTQLRPITHAAVVLASASPRRQELLRQVGIPFVVDPSTVDEAIAPDWAPGEIAERLAEKKAQDVAARHADADLVIGADTVVFLDEVPLGKPTDEADARRMLALLSGNTHEVRTGYALLAPKTRTRVTGSVTSRVRFRDLDPDEIKRYVASGEPMDKAGSYAIQGLAALFVAAIDGDYFNIVGLPLQELNLALRQLGWRVI